VIPILMALAAAAGPPPAPPPAPASPAADPHLKSCIALIRTAPERALADSAAWGTAGGGASAALCEGLADAALEHWPEASAAFEKAASAAAADDARRANFLVEAGNSWLAAGDNVRAAKDFDAALSLGILPPQLAGEVWLDRSRASVAAGDLAAARADLDRGLALVPADPFAWYLSAALARRQNDMARAGSDIAKAVSLAPDDAAVLLEAGNIAGLAGDVAGARAFYARAARSAPNSEPGRAAAAALAANPEATPAATPR
jgi:tetratricopeptide (TPR) repeat protein